MTDSLSSRDRIRAILVAVATAGTILFNWLAATGRMNGVTPDTVSDRYQTPITPAGFAFTIWVLIYAGLIAFCVYQLRSANLVKYRNMRTLYIASSVLNCGWIYFWLRGEIAVCVVLIVLLAFCLFLICSRLRSTGSTNEYWLVNAPFSLYFGWVTAASLVNLAVLLVGLNVQMSETVWTTVAVVLILIAALLGVIVRIAMEDYLFPLAIAWALTAIAVKQSGQTAIVVACAVGVIACLIASLSFVVNLPSSTTVPGNLDG